MKRDFRGARPPLSLHTFQLQLTHTMAAAEAEMLAPPAEAEMLAPPAVEVAPPAEEVAADATYVEGLCVCV